MSLKDALEMFGLHDSKELFLHIFFVLEKASGLDNLHKKTTHLTILQVTVEIQASNLIRIWTLSLRVLNYFFDVQRRYIDVKGLEEERIK